MKSIFLLLMVITITTMQAQDRNTGDDIYYQEEKESFGFDNLKTDGENIYFQKVFEGNSESLKTKLLSKGASVVSSEPNRVSYSIEKYKINYKKFGGKTMWVPIYLRYDFSFSILIEKKENKYRATITNIKITDDENSTLGEPDIYSLSDMALKNNGKFRNSHEKALTYINKDFADLLQVQSEMFNDNW